MNVMLHREFLDDVTRQTWSDFLGIALAEQAATSGDAECAARISIDGAWSGTLVVGCSRGLARQAAATMYSLPAADIDEASWRDTLNEVANIIGGNLKALLPGPSRLGLPAPLDAWTPDAAATIAYHSDAGPLYITLTAAGRGQPPAGGSLPSHGPEAARSQA